MSFDVKLGKEFDSAKQKLKEKWKKIAIDRYIWKVSDQMQN